MRLSEELVFRFEVINIGQTLRQTSEVLYKNFIVEKTISLTVDK